MRADRAARFKAIGNKEPTRGTVVRAIDLSFTNVPYGGEFVQFPRVYNEPPLDENMRIDSYQAIEIFDPELSGRPRVVYIRTGTAPLFRCIFEVAKVDWRLAVRKAMKQFDAMDSDDQLGYLNDPLNEFASDQATALVREEMLKEMGRRQARAVRKEATEIKQRRRRLLGKGDKL